MTICMIYSGVMALTNLMNNGADFVQCHRLITIR